MVRSDYHDNCMEVRISGGERLPKGLHGGEALVMRNDYQVICMAVRDWWK